MKSARSAMRDASTIMLFSARAPAAQLESLRWTRHAVGFYVSSSPVRVSGDEQGGMAVRKLVCAALVSFTSAGVVALAQDVGTDARTKTRITVEDGKDVTVTGCIGRTADGNFTLTHGAGKDGVLGSYVLVADDGELDDLKDHVGHRVEIKGKAADQGDGRLQIKSETEVRTHEGDRKKRASTTNVEGDLNGLPYLGVKSVRMLASVCP